MVASFFGEPPSLSIEIWFLSDEIKIRNAIYSIEIVFKKTIYFYNN